MLADRLRQVLVISRLVVLLVGRVFMLSVPTRTWAILALAVAVILVAARPVLRLHQRHFLELLRRPTAAAVVVGLRSTLAVPVVVLAVRAS